MTILTPMPGITAPLPPLATLAARDTAPTDTPTDPPTPTLLPSRRGDGWTAAAQRVFLEAIAQGHTVGAACAQVGLTSAAAYAFRNSARGAAFALGWRAATLVAREHVADTLMARALDGQVDSYTRADGVTVTRHKFDNRLAMALLARLDRQVETAPDADVKAARLVAQEFDAFLNQIERDDGPARAGLFLARRCGGLGEAAPGDGAGDLAPIFTLAAADRLVRTGVATAGEVEVADLDPAARAGWTADQWQRADAAGLLTIAAPAPDAEPDPAPATPPACQDCQHSPAARSVGPCADAARDAGTSGAEDEPVWWDDETEDWMTWFPPVAGHEPFTEHGRPGAIGYQRSLSEAEAALMDAAPCPNDDLVEMAAERDAYFAGLAASLDPDAGGDEVGSGDPLAAPGVDPATVFQ